LHLRKNLTIYHSQKAKLAMRLTGCPVCLSHCGRGIRMAWPPEGVPL